MPGVKVLEVEKVPETVDVQKTMKSMIEDDGAKLIFPTSTATSTRTSSPWPRNTRTSRSSTAAACGKKARIPTNLGTYFGYIDEAEYLSGIVAAYATKSKKLGFIAAKPIPQVRRNINAFTLGRAASIRRSPARSSSPATGRCRSRRRRPPTA